MLSPSRDPGTFVLIRHTFLRGKSATVTSVAAEVFVLGGEERGSRVQERSGGRKQ